MKDTFLQDWWDKHLKEEFKKAREAGIVSERQRLKQQKEAERYKQMKAAVDEGMSYSQMSKKFKLSYNAIANYCQTRKLDTLFKEKKNEFDRLREFCKEHNCSYVYLVRVKRLNKMTVDEVIAYRLDREKQMRVKK